MKSAVEIVSIPIREEDVLADPYSSDLFGQADNASGPIDVIADPVPAKSPDENTPDWVKYLPKFSQDAVATSPEDAEFPNRLTDIFERALEDAFGEIVYPESGSLRCHLESIVDCDLFAEASTSELTGSLALRIVHDPTRTHAAVIVGSNFVRSVIDKIFGPSAYEPANRISPIETAIAEFLISRVAARINDRLGEQLISVGASTLNPTELFADHHPGAKASIALETETGHQSFQILMPREFRSAITAAGTIFDNRSAEERAAKLFRSLASVPLRAQLGSTRLEIVALASLEPGDVVIVEESQLDWSGTLPKGDLRLFAGTGTNFVVTGELVEEISTASAMRIHVKDVFSREAVNEIHTARFIMDDKLTGEPLGEESIQKPDSDVELREDNEIPASLENLQLRLRVELAGNTLSLREIRSLREGQVIDLGRGPNDTVNLVTDGGNETVAVGELVDIEGRLGVRLTKVFL